MQILTVGVMLRGTVEQNMAVVQLRTRRSCN
jgi:hypothetical protein